MNLVPQLDAEFRLLIPPLQQEEKLQLEENLQRDGCLDPLVVWETDGKNILLDGHNRYEICGRLGIPFKIKTVEIESREHAKLWIEECQAGRRNLSQDQQAVLWDGIRERRSARARSERAKEARASVVSRNPVKKNSDLSVTSTDKSKKPRDTRKAVAVESKLPERKLRAVAEVKRHAPDLVQKVRDGQMTLAAAARDVRRKTLRENLESIGNLKAKELAGKYDVIVIDPPWPMDKLEGDVRSWDVGLDYPTMTLEEISSELHAKLDRHTEPDAHVFLWTTQKFLPAAIGMLTELRLTYSCCFVWHKNGGFQPFDMPQYNCEFVLYARKGSPRFVATKQFNACFEAPRGKHSEKPEEFYELLRRVTAGRRLDMFNRRKITGFDGWGKESVRLRD